MPGRRWRGGSGVRRYTYDAAAARLGSPMDVLRGLPSHNNHVGGRLAIGPDRRLYLTIGDGGANFGQNRCTANRALDLPTAAAVQARDWSAYWGKILQSAGRIHPGGQPNRRRHAQPCLLLRAPQPARPGVRAHRPALRIGARSESSDDEVNLIESGRTYGWPRGRLPGRQGLRLRQLVGGERAVRRSSPRRESHSRVVPVQAESSWKHPQFTPPLRTFFTVETAAEIRGLGSATIAPGGLDIYTGTGIAGWRNSLLALSLVRGIVLPAAAGSGRPLGHRHADGAIPDGEPISRHRHQLRRPDDLPGHGSDRAAAQRRRDRRQTLTNPGSTGVHENDGLTNLRTDESIRGLAQPPA